MEECLDSFLPGDLGISSEVFLVDNGSTDGSLERIRRRFPSVLVVENGENLGFARANNRAIAMARGEYVLLLNPDTLIPDKAIFRTWTDFMDRHPATGASGCRLVFPDGSHQVGDAGFRPGIISAFNFAFFLSRLFPLRFKGLFLSSPSGTHEREVDWICGADLLMRRSILIDTGLLDEEIFMYAEDVEWGCRIRSLGHMVYYLPWLTIVHLQGMSLGRKRGRQKTPVLWLQNLRRLFEGYNRHVPLWCFDLILAAGYFLRAALYLGAAFAPGREQRRPLEKARRMRDYTLYLLRNLGKYPRSSITQ